MIDKIKTFRGQGSVEGHTQNSHPGDWSLHPIRNQLFTNLSTVGGFFVCLFFLPKLELRPSDVDLVLHDKTYSTTSA